MENEKKSVTGLVLGITSLVSWVIPIIGIPVSIVGVAYGIKGLKEKRRYAQATLICSIIGLSLSVANAAVGAYLGATGQNPLVNEMLQ